jgi:hypothetical protein
MPPLTFEQVVKLANPYTNYGSSGPGPMTFENPIVIEQQVHLGMWAFKGVPYYIEKALKIPYTYTTSAGEIIEDYLLIGFAGGGAY